MNVTGEVYRVTYENETTGFRVLRLREVRGDLGGREQLTVVGTLPNLSPGVRLRVTGRLVDDPRHGEQLKAEAAFVVEPETVAAVEKYLASGLLPGIGPALAKRIVAVFGTQTLAILDQQPERLGSIPGIGAARLREVRQAWQRHRLESTTLLLLQQHGVPPALARRIVDRYGDRVAVVVQKHPFQLASEIRGVGFATADRIASSVGIGQKDPERIRAGILQVMGQFTDQGHVLCPRDRLIPGAAGLLEVPEALVDAALDQLWADGSLVVDGSDVYLTRLYDAEMKVAAGLSLRASVNELPLPAVDAALASFEQAWQLKLVEEQRHAVLAATQGRVVVITGGPGVGKTTIVRAIAHVFEALRLEVKLAAPTGRAAKRLSEATGRPASTLHRLLEFEPRACHFLRNASQKLQAAVVVVDEASMVDLPLAAAIVDALSPTTRLLLVGDADQLPSVGPGAVLRDLVSSESGTVIRLNHIHRQSEASAIVLNAHRIRSGQMPESAPAGSHDGDFFILDRSDAERAADDIIELVTSRIPRRFGFDPRSQIQVLTPMHRGPVGTVALNTRLQAALNPDAPALGLQGRTLRVGDKVMQVKNDYDREVYNGDLGIVTAIDADPRGVVVRFDNRQISYRDAETDMLSLAYATSIHKSQGSEYPAVVVPFLTAHFVMLSRNILYTAVTRARHLCVLITDSRALHIALAEDRREERFTRLASRLLQEKMVGRATKQSSGTDGPLPIREGC